MCSSVLDVQERERSCEDDYFTDVCDGEEDLSDRRVQVDLVPVAAENLSLPKCPPKKFEVRNFDEEVIKRTVADEDYSNACRYR